MWCISPTLLLFYDIPHTAQKIWNLSAHHEMHFKGITRFPLPLRRVSYIQNFEEQTKSEQQLRDITLAEVLAEAVQ